MTKIVTTRFAPSPTGKLHIGNIRIAIINWLYAKKYGGKFILRIDNTDKVRNQNQYKENIVEDLNWLGLKWNSSFDQLGRFKKHDQIKQRLIAEKRLYPCYETQEELDIKRKIQLSRGLPPIYDRSSLKLTNEQVRQYNLQGRKAYYRFLINDTKINWTDIIKGKIEYQGGNLNDPIVIRTDGTMTYMLSSTIDDIDCSVSHIIRGEDHVSNTAIQIQMFEAIKSYSTPDFGHLSLIKSKEKKLSKRIGGFEISELRSRIEPMAINNFLTFIGSSNKVDLCKTMSDLINNFNINNYSKSPTNYIEDDLKQLNHKLMLLYNYSDITEYLKSNNLTYVTEEFWLAVRPNIFKLSDIKEWWQICHNPKKVVSIDKELLSIAIKYLPHKITHSTWIEWTKKIHLYSGKKGKDLFLPLRLAITGKSTGPELKNILPLLSYDDLVSRLNQ